VISPQEEWRRHLSSCAVCYKATGDDEAGLCNRGRAIWAEVASAPAPYAAEHGAQPAALAPIDDTQPIAVRVRR
jgi:hypothetical protein